jgi:hypothetical protein
LQVLALVTSPKLGLRHPGAPAHPSIPKMLRAKERTPTPYPSIVFTFGLVVESIKEVGGVSHFLIQPVIFIVTQQLASN